MKIHQNVNLYASILKSEETAKHELDPARDAWIQVARGRVGLNGYDLGAGDGAAISKETTLTIAAKEKAEFLLFDLE